MKLKLNSHYYAAIRATRKEGETITLDLADLSADMMTSCFCSKDTDFRSGAIARVKLVRFIETRTVENVNPNYGQETLQSVKRRCVEVEILSTHLQLQQPPVRKTLNWVSLMGDVRKKEYRGANIEDRISRAITKAQAEHPKHDFQFTVS